MTGNISDFIIDPRLAGISGDMLLSALASLAGETTRMAFNEFARNTLDGLGLQGNVFEIRRVTVNGFAGNQVYQVFQEDLEKRTFKAIRGHFQRVFALNKLSERAIAFCNSVVDLLIETEARVHGKNADDGTAHFHELGSADTVIDICGVAYLIDHLQVWDCRFITLPLNTGSGKIKIGHGSVSVPAPAVIEILSKYKLLFFSDGTQAELATPTGVALLAKLVTRVESNFPLFRSESHGVGHGTRKTDQGNYLRIYAGEVQRTDSSMDGLREEEVVVIETHVDDVPGEIIGSVFNPLFSSGALDVTAYPLIAKKNRPGWCIRAITRPENAEQVIKEFFRHLRTLGVRFYSTKRLVLPRYTKTVTVKIGDREHEVRLKQAGKPEKPLFFKIEFEDLQKVSEIHNMSIQDVNDLIRAQLQVSGMDKVGKDNGN